MIETLAPCRAWPVLGAREQGLLVPLSTRWGVLAAWTPMMGQLVLSQRLDGYAFSSRGANPWQLYFESSGEGDNFLPNWQRTLADGTIGRFDAASFRPTTPNRWGLSRTAHIVEVEVNRGHSPPPSRERARASRSTGRGERRMIAPNCPPGAPCRPPHEAAA